MSSISSGHCGRLLSCPQADSVLIIIGWAQWSRPDVARCKVSPGIGI